MVLSTIKYPPIAEGATAEVFAWDKDKILKLYHEGASPGEAEQEAARASIAYDAGLNTPAVTVKKLNSWRLSTLLFHEAWRRK